MNKTEYLERIVIDEKDLTVSAQTLGLLQKRHLLEIPFENLDIYWKRPITTNIAKFYEKIILEKRGGFCYELNGLFNALLQKIGFQTKIISARVSRGSNEFGAEYDHLAIMTKIGDEEFIVDVGFGDFTAEPLKFVLNVGQTDANGIFLIRKRADDYFEVFKKDVENWQSEYIFKDIARDLSEFSEMCNFHQTSPDSHFTKGKLCSVMTQTGRKTLTDTKFIKTKIGERNETEINSDTEFYRILRCEFGIEQKPAIFG